MSGRIYTTFKQATNEMQRDLKEMGRELKTKTVQGRPLEHTNEYDTVELLEHSFTVTQPRVGDLDLPNEKWARADWQERLSGIKGVPVNPGMAYLLRTEKGGDSITWSEYLVDGKFEYTYSEQFARGNQVQVAIDKLKEDNNTRQAMVLMMAPEDLDQARIPCSISWQFIYREGKLNVIYHMRSCEFATHFQNDMFMTMQMLHYVAEQTNLPVGMFSMVIGSFHCYQRNLHGVY